MAPGPAQDLINLISGLGPRPGPRELNQLNYVVYILWGAHARSKKKLITNSSLILEATHPSPLSAHKGFFGSNHFSKANEYLTRFRDSPINWQLD